MANIEVSLSSSSNAMRRRKGTSLSGCGGLNGSVSSRASPRPDLLHSGGGILTQSTTSIVTAAAASAAAATSHTNTPKELRSAVQDREEIIQNLRVKLGLGKLPRPSVTPLDESERPVAEQRLNRLRIDGENKRIAIRNLKAALEKLDITDNIDVRIRQAELEYALGREELQLLSLVEESRALQARLDKSKPESNTLFSIIQSGINLSLQAVQATVGRWAANTKPDSPGLWIEWALDGEGLYRGDRIIEINGKLCTCKTRDDLQHLIGTSGRCQLVVIRKRSAPPIQQHQQQQHHQLLQFQEDNQRLQHRISYLEDQVKELHISNKDCTATVINNGNFNQNNSTNGNNSNNNMNNVGGHITSISISAPSTPPMIDKPQTYQRGNFITTIIDGKPVDPPPPSATTLKYNNHNYSNNNNNTNNNNNITKTIIKENHNGASQHNNHKHYHHNRMESENIQLMQQNKILSASKVSINSDVVNMKRERDRHKYNHHVQTGGGRLNGDSTNHYYNNYDLKKSTSASVANIDSYTARSVEYLNNNNNNNNNINSNGYSMDKPKNKQIDTTTNRSANRLFGTAQDLRSVKSLDFDSDTTCTIIDNRKRDLDYTSEPVVDTHRVRPQPPKKPLRLSLQRAQSLQTVEPIINGNVINSNSNHIINAILENDKKRAIKRAHKSSKTPELQQQYIENNIPLQTASLGRNKYI